MPEPNRKSKMISLRLSAEEYQALHKLYPTYGARNVSDFARLAMQRIIGHPTVADVSVNKIHELDERLSAIEERVALLFAREKELA
jgi:hypothetical protein